MCINIDMLLVFKLLIAVLALACLFSPIAYEALVGYFGSAPWPFSRVYDRVILVVLIAVLLVYRKRIHLTELLSCFKAGTGSCRMSLIAQGLILALLSGAVLLPLVISDQGPLIWNFSGSNNLVWRIAKTLPAAVLIAFIEEAIFRLFLFRTIAQFTSLFSAALISSAIYSFVHFVGPDKGFVYPGYSIFLGFEYLADIFANAFAMQFLYSMLGLLLVGMALCYAFVASGSIYLSIGLHAGWVLLIKFITFTTTTAEGFEFSNTIARRYYILSEPLAWCSFLVVILLIKFLIASRRTSVADHNLP